MYVIVRMKNDLHLEEVARMYEICGYKVKLVYLDWYRWGYFIQCSKGE